MRWSLVPECTIQTWVGMQFKNYQIAQESVHKSHAHSGMHSNIKLNLWLPTLWRNKTHIYKEGVSRKQKKQQDQQEKFQLTQSAQAFNG